LISGSKRPIDWSLEKQAVTLLSELMTELLLSRLGVSYFPALFSDRKKEI